MRDDATPAMLAGRGLSGHRRTPRVRYHGQDIELRMPSATAIKRFSKASGESTFDVPVTGAYPDRGGGRRPVSGWVRVTASPGGRWTAVALGFPPGGDETVAEAVSAVLEARRPSFALRDTAELIARHRARPAAQGAEVHQVDSAWISAVGYDDDAQLMITQTAAGRVYGHLVSRARYDAVEGAQSKGRMFNRLVKGSGSVPVANCPSCGRFFAQSAPHSCPTPAAPRPGAVHNTVAQAAATATMAAAKSRAAAPKTVDVARWMYAQAQSRSDRVGLYGPPGWTAGDVASAVAPFTDSGHVPYAYVDRDTLAGRASSANGTGGLLRFAGLDGERAMTIGRAMTRKALGDRQGAGPTARSLLAAAARHPGMVELRGYVTGPSRDDERVTVEGLFVYDTTMDERAVRAAARDRLGLDHVDDPSDVRLVDVPWRTGVKAWQLLWR